MKSNDNPPTAAKILDALESSTQAAFALARALLISAETARTNDDEWTRIPAPKAKCPISRWSRSPLEANAKKHPERLRTKLVDGDRYYAGRDVREWLASPP